MSILELCYHYPAILQFTALANSTIYTNHLHSSTFAIGDLYHRILLGYAIPKHFQSRILDQDCQR